ncbi:MAG: hypothetical protein ACJA1N_002534, partial [Saprospiraceae bacterium]
MIQKIGSITFLVFFTFVAVAQDIAIGEWKAHLPFRKGISVTQSETDVYLAFESQIAIVNKGEFSIEQLNKVNGLSDVSIQVVKYNEDKKILVVAYENGNIDLVKESEIININQIKETLTYTNKAINHISFDGDYAYLACNFGIVQINLVRNEIKGTFPFTNPEKVNATVSSNGKVYAFTDEGIFEGDTTLNLLDFSAWRKHDDTDGLWQDSRSLTATLFDGQVYADVGDTLMRYNGITWETFEVYEWNGSGFDTLSQFHSPNFDIKYIEPNYNETSIVVS